MKEKNANSYQAEILEGLNREQSESILDCYHGAPPMDSYKIGFPDSP